MGARDVALSMYCHTLLFAQLTAHVKLLDGPHTDRAVTSAVPGVNDDMDNFFAPLDVAGYNYSPDQYVHDHDRIPGTLVGYTMYISIVYISRYTYSPD